MVFISAGKVLVAAQPLCFVPKLCYMLLKFAQMESKKRITYNPSNKTKTKKKEREIKR